MPSPSKEASSPTPKTSPPAVSTILLKADLALRALLFATTIASVAVMVSSKQTKALILSPAFPPLALVAKFNYSSAFIYFVAAISVSCFYSLVTTAASALSVLRTHRGTKTLFHLLVLDAVILGVVASALGAGAAVGYLGEKGNSHVGWNKVCNLFDVFCRHIGASVFLSLVAAIILIFLVLISAYSLYRRSL
ncbi:hypothetical protein HPP92_010496 [Vanilla planifolia]|uniref:CASP-like protein n=1 Tax=Vanilla planifolia TaxID=51239 RepID=A0A835RAJ4_VANPL|nr:hypothetical protein HPP92_010496 [Vanilla planifolia]